MIPSTWADIRTYVRGNRQEVIDEEGRRWRRSTGAGSNVLFRKGTDCDQEHRLVTDETPMWLPPAGIPEPPDETRIEFEYNTDRFAARRSDRSSAAADWPAGDGGYVWTIYPGSVPCTWTAMWAMFGDSLRTAVRLVPVPDDIPLFDQWPTNVEEVL